MIARAPNAPISMNHASISGPANQPIRPLPSRWVRKTPTTMNAEATTTQWACSGPCTGARPPIALSTLMAGVMIPSPYKSAAPINAAQSSHRPRPRVAASSRDRASARSAKSPPSPPLSARSRSEMYLPPTMSSSDQMMIESVPSTVSGASGEDENESVARRAYKGLVPMSPNTTPTAPSASSGVPFLACGDPPMRAPYQTPGTDLGRRCVKVMCRSLRDDDLDASALL